MSELRSNRITDIAGTASPIIPGGVLQVKYFQLTTSQTETIGGGYTDQVVSNFNINITPKSTSSIIKLEAQLFFETANAVHSSIFFFYRDSVKLANTQTSPGNRGIGIAVGLMSYYANDADSTPNMLSMGYFDSPSTTSQITYKLGANMSATNNLFINRTVTDTNANGYERGVSFISATEIGG